MPRKRHSEAFFVGEKGFPSPGAALSYAQGLASRWPNDEQRSFYVRDALDRCVYRVDLEGGGIVLTYAL